MAFDEDQTLEEVVEGDFSPPGDPRQVQDNTVDIDRASASFPQISEAQARAYEDSILAKLASGQDLSPEEITYAQGLSPDHRSVLEEKVREAQSEFAKTPQGFQQQLKQTQPEFNRFLERRTSILEEGGSQVVQITDTHTTSDSLEKIIGLRMLESDFDTQRDVLLHTGDIIPDFFESEMGTGAYSTERIVRDGSLFDEQAEEFREAYSTLLEFAGVSDKDLETGTSFQGEDGQNKFLKFKLIYLLGEHDPTHLSGEDHKELKRAQLLVHKHLRDAIKKHARREYEGVREVLDKFGLTPENFTTVPGNHDIPEVMHEVLGEYVIKPGEKRELNNGFTVANFLSGSSGSVLGSEFADLYGLVPSERRKLLRHESELFQDILSTAREYGVDITPNELDRLHEIARSQNSYLSTRNDSEGLVKYFKRIESEVDETIRKGFKDIPEIDLSDVDAIIGHGDPLHNTYAAEEDKEVIRRTRESGYKGVFFNGHVHGERIHENEGILHINPGSSKEGGGQIGLYTSRGEFDSGILAKYDKASGNLERKFYDREHPIGRERDYQ